MEKYIQTHLHASVLEQYVYIYVCLHIKVLHSFPAVLYGNRLSKLSEKSGISKVTHMHNHTVHI